jgi:uncharacterized membrane protein YbhN (UPF0104 family)
MFRVGEGPGGESTLRDPQAGRFSIDQTPAGALRSLIRALTAEAPSRRMLVVGLVVGLPVIALFLSLATRDLDLGQVGRALGHADPAQVVAALVAIAVLYLLQAERWRILAGPDPRPPRRALVELVIGSVAVDNLAPGRPGDLMRGYRLGRLARIPFTKALASMIVDRAGDVVILTAVIAAALPVVEHPRWLMRLVLAALCLALLATGALALARRRALRRGADPAEEPDRGGARRQLGLLVRGLGAATAPGRLGRAAALRLLSWLCFALSCWWVARALGIALSAPETLVVTAAVNLGAAIALALLMQAVWWVPSTLAGIALAARALWARLPGRVAMATAERDAA